MVQRRRTNRTASHLSDRANLPPLLSFRVTSAPAVLTVLVPDGQAVIADDDVVRDLVRQFVLPGLVPDSLRTVQSKG